MLHNCSTHPLFFDLWTLVLSSLTATNTLRCNNFIGTHGRTLSSLFVFSFFFYFSKRHSLHLLRLNILFLPRSLEKIFPLPSPPPSPCHPALLCTQTIGPSPLPHSRYILPAISLLARTQQRKHTTQQTSMHPRNNIPSHPNSLTLQSIKHFSPLSSVFY